MGKRKLAKILLACLMCFALTGCGEQDESPKGGNAYTQIVQQVQNMPETTNGREIETAIADVFGVDIDLPAGEYSAEVFSYGGVSSYMVTVSDSEQTAAAYFNSIKGTMTARGYIAYEEDLAFSKIEGMVVYSLAVENDGTGLVIYAGVTNLESGNLGGSSGIGGGENQSPYLTSWPSAQIREVLGVDIPTYTGNAYGFLVDSYVYGADIGVTVTIYGASAEDMSYYYGQTIPSAGYSANTEYGGRVKTTGEGNVVVISGYMQTGEVASFSAYLVKNGGQYDSWPNEKLTEYSFAGIPSYTGGASFDCTDLGTQNSIYESYTEAAEALIEGYETALQFGVVDEELTAQYNEALEILEQAEYIRMYRITVYGTNEAEKQAYIEKILNSPNDANEEQFREMETDEFSRRYFYARDYEITITLGEITDGKLTVDLLRMPVSLLDSEEGGNGDGGGGSGSGSSTGYLYQDWEDLPTNVRFTYKSLYDSEPYAEYTVTKIGNDYLVADGFTGSTVYFKYSAGVWTLYVYYVQDSVGEWIEATEKYSNLDEHSIFDSMEFMFDNQYLDDYTKSGTETVAGLLCDVYTLSEDMSEFIGYTYVITQQTKMTADGLVLETSAATQVDQQTTVMAQKIENWDTEVSSFGIDVPA